jgi:hypothetical protein
VARYHSDAHGALVSIADSERKDGSMLALVGLELLIYLAVLGALATAPLFTWLVVVVLRQPRRPRLPAGS